MTDVVNPTISILAPAPNSKNNLLDSRISFRIEDTLEVGSGIDLSTVYVTINGQYAYYQGVLKPGFDGYYSQDPDQNSYYFEVQRDAYYSPLESVNVSVSARDFAGNHSATNVFSFIALDNVPPSIIEVTPANETGQVASTQTVSFRLRTTPKEVEIDLNTLVVTMGGLILDAYGAPVLDAYGDPLPSIVIAPDATNQIAFDQRVVSIQKDLDNLGYKIFIVPLQPLPLSSKITLDIYIEDTAGNSNYLQSFFTTVDDAAPILLNEFPIPSSTTNSIASVVSFTLSDKQGSYSGSGIDLVSLQVLVDQRSAIKNGIAQVGFSVSIISNFSVNGYDIIITPDDLLFPHKTINVAITVSDRNLNILSTNYFFTTEDIVAPTILFVSPLQNATNVARDNSIIIDIESEVAVEEIDVSSIIILVDGTPTFLNNSFQPGFTGLALATTKTALTLTVVPDTVFSLGQSVLLDITAQDVFGNSVQATNTFTVTNTSKITSSISPLPNIYNTLGFNPNFSSAGSYLTLTMSTTDPQGVIIYTLDGSDPTIDGYFIPQGTTQTYSAPFQVSSKNNVIVRFFAFNPFISDIESQINGGAYVFSDCPEIDTFDDLALINGLEYTTKVQPKSITYKDSNLYATGDIVSDIKYVHDLGRSSFIDSLDFNKTGIVKFRTKVVEDVSTLPTTKWSNTLYNLVDNNEISYIDGYGLATSTSQNNIKISGHSQQLELFTDEARVEINDRLFESFTINTDMRLSLSKIDAVGGKSFVRIQDNNYNLEVQQFFSKLGLINSTNNNILFQEPSTLTFGWQDGYLSLTDGYRGFTTLTNPPSIVSENIEFISVKTEKIVTEVLTDPELVEIFDITSYTPSVYNTFHYNDGYDAYDAYDSYTYSSALVAKVKYKRIDSSTKTHFTIPVKGIPLDASISLLNSENLDTSLDKFIPAETNGIFILKLFLEAGDYNYRFNVEYSDGYQNLERQVSNPFQFRTREDLSSVIFGDFLEFEGQSFKISSAKRLTTGNYIIEFVKEFPLSTLDILSWQITRSSQVILTSTFKIEVDNVSKASIGYDTEGVVANLIVETRREVEFVYASSNTTKVSIIGAFNSFDKKANYLIEQLDPSQIEKIFDENLLEDYENSYINFHKMTITPPFPLIVDRVRFVTNTPADGYQRARLLLDDSPISKSNYKARTQDGYLANYLSTTDLQVSSADGHVEWQFQVFPGNPNNKFKSSIGLSTRMDSLNQISRKHSKFEIFTLPDLPVLTSDYHLSADKTKIVRQDTSGFGSIGNNVTIRYSKVKTIPAFQALLNIKNEGLIANFIRSNIVIEGPQEFSVYVDRPYLFKVGDNVMTSDGISYLQSTIVEVLGQAGGLIVCDSLIHTQGVMVKDYKITSDQNNYYATLEAPKFTTAYIGTIVDVQVTGNTTKVRLKNVLLIDPSLWLGGRFTYPQLDTPSKIIETGSEILQIGPQIIQLIYVVIDQILAPTNIYPTLGVTIETYNSTETIVDYVFNKNSKEAYCLNKSSLCNNYAEVTYEANIVPYQVPNQMQQIDGYQGDQVTILTTSNISDISFSEIEGFRVNFFNGVDSLAPQFVNFTINDITKTVSLASALIVDGYLDSLYDPTYPNTGQIVEFNLDVKDLLDGYDGYESSRFNYMKIDFIGNPTYYIGEVQALTKSSLTDSKCRIVLNNKELFVSPMPSGNLTTKFIIQVDRGSLLVYFNGTLVLTRPILFINPKVSFGGTAKALDDYIEVDFNNTWIDQYYTISPAKIQQVGRYIEIEGTIVSL